MAAIWQEVVITWDGEELAFRPTLAFINHLEQGEGRSISRLLYRIDQGDLPSGIACEVIAKAINWARKGQTDEDGKPVQPATAEDVYEETAGVGVDVITLVYTILIACMPAPKVAKKKSSKGKAKPKAKAQPKA